jgi:FemAB-related protein (PEP-CTERM system-associated)
MHIRPYTPADRQIWDSYVHVHPAGTIFHTRAWQDAVARAFGHPEHSLILLDSQNGYGKLAGILPLFQIKSLLWGNFLVSTPFAEQGGPLADNELLALELSRRSGEIIRELNLEYLELRNKHPLPDLLQKDLYFSFQREIMPDLNDNLQAIPRKSRRMVRQGIRNKLQASTGHHLLPQFYHLLAQNFHSLGTPIFAYSWFEILLEVFADQALILLIQEPKGNYIAGVLSFFYQDKVLPYYAGSMLQYRMLAPNDFMYWKLLEYAWQKGYKVFDFGRSKKDTGSYSFKKHWGFEPSPLAYQYILHKKQEMPNISPTNPKYQLQIKAWRRMPLGWTKRLGPAIAKYLC